MYVLANNLSLVTLFIVCCVGLAVGSFLNVILTRFRTQQLWKRADSYCMSCGVRLKIVDLIPVLSHVILRGKCRACGCSFKDSPIIELITAVLFCLMYIVYGLTLQGFIMALLMVFVVLISRYDVLHKIIPDEFSVPFIIIAISTLFVKGNSIIIDNRLIVTHIITAVVSSLFFLCLWYFSKGKAMGFADSILGFGIGLILGWPGTLNALILSFWIGAIVSIFIMLVERITNLFPRRKTFFFKRRYKRSNLTMKSEIPFGPFLMIGMIIVIVTNIQLFSLL